MLGQILYLECSGSLRRGKETLLLEELHDQLSALFQHPTVAFVWVPATRGLGRTW